MRMVAVTVTAVVLAGCGSTPDQVTASQTPTQTPSQVTSPHAPSTAGTGSSTASPRRGTPPRTGQAPAQVPGVPRSGPLPQRPLLPPAAPGPRLTGLGLGGVPVGATLKEFARALRRVPVPMNADDRSVFASHSCAIRQLQGLSGVGFMVIGDDPDGQVRRISIGAGSDVRTDKGAGVGTSLGAVRAVSGRGIDEPFEHFPVGGDAVLVRGVANRYLAFIGDKQDRVVEIRLGTKPEVLSPEGCA